MGALAVALSLPIFDRGMFLMDEGHILMFADLVAGGGELYRDATLLPLPGAFYLLAGAFELFGPSIRVARWIVVFEFAALAVCVFLLLARLVGARLAWAGVALLAVYRIWAFPHWQLYSYSTLALALLAGALLAFTRFLESERRVWLAGSGLLLGLAVVSKQDYGAAGFVALHAVLLLAHRSAGSGERAPLTRWLVAFDAPVAAVGALLALHFARQGLLLEMLRQTVWNHLFGIATFEYTSLPPLFPLFSQEPFFREPGGIAAYAPSILFQTDWDRIREAAWYRDGVAFDLAVKLFFYAPYALVAAAVARLVWLRGALRDPERRLPWLRECALAALAAMLVLVLNKPVDYLHVAVLYWPLLALAVVWAGAWIRGRPARARFLAVAAGVPLLALAGYTAMLAATLRAQNSAPLRTERAGVFVPPAEERVIGSIVDWVRDESRPDQRVAVLPYFPLISFLAERRAPHRAIYTFWPIAYIADRERQIAEALEAPDAADVAVYHFTQALVFPRMQEFAPELFAYLVDHWEIERVFSDEGWGYMAAGLRRSRGAPPGRALLSLDAPPEALAAWEEDAEGRRRPAGGGEPAAALARWPFRPVLAVRPRAGGGRRGVTLPLDVPPGARLATAVGVEPSAWFLYPPSRVTFTLDAVADGRRVTLATRTLDPHRDHRDRGWFEIEVPLDAWAGRRIELELSASAERETGEVLAMGGFAVPRVIAPDGAQ